MDKSEQDILNQQMKKAMNQKPSKLKKEKKPLISTKSNIDFNDNGFRSDEYFPKKQQEERKRRELEEKKQAIQNNQLK